MHNDKKNLKILAHLSFKLKWAFLILVVRKSVNFSRFHLLLATGLITTRHKAFLGNGNSILSKWTS